MNRTTHLLEGDLTPELRDRYLAGGQLAVDTETRGLKIHRDRLCLVQMCDANGEITLVRVTQSSAPLLQEVLESPKVEKIFHFARFDLAALRHWLGIQVAPVFCTKIASRMVRTYTDRHGLKELTKELLNIELDKEQQSSDWANPNLSDKQISYAANDVIHLIALRNQLVAMLERESLLSLAQSTMAFLPHRVSLDLLGWEEDIFSHV
ncbi:MAG: ribonuclease D [Magnetococcales bacterium]|nr:ribonuclease D [Magnetococcales bacterium]NGZ26737.1 ribonuclease D [Magnetococcales bacterium]